MAEAAQHVIFPDLQRSPASEPRHAPRSGARLSQVDGLRAVAALWVVAYHGYVFFYERAVGPRGPLLVWMSRGHLGVPMFLVLSGFCLTLPSLQAGRYTVEGVDFLRRRAWRILPPYYLVMGSLSALIQLPALRRMASQAPTDVTDLLLHVAMLHNLSGEHIFRISGPFWSIALECQLYGIFPLLLYGMRRPGVTSTAVLALAAFTWASAPQASSPFSQFAYWHSLPSMLPLFVLGQLAARAVASGATRGNLAAGLGVACFTAALCIPAAGPRARLASQGCAAVGTALLLVCSQETLAVRVLRARSLVFLGGVSYTLYLTHNPLISFAGKWATARLSGWPLHLTACLSVLGAVGGAVLLFPWLERPFHALARRGGLRPRPAEVLELRQGAVPK